MYIYSLECPFLGGLRLPPALLIWGLKLHLLAAARSLLIGRWWNYPLLWSLALPKAAFFTYFNQCFLVFMYFSYYFLSWLLPFCETTERGREVQEQRYRNSVTYRMLATTDERMMAEGFQKLANKVASQCASVCVARLVLVCVVVPLCWWLYSWARHTYPDSPAPLCSPLLRMCWRALKDSLP